MEKVKLETWGELLDVLEAEGWGQDEYLSAMYASYAHPGEADAWRARKLWDDAVRWIACYWVIGDSEGYYAHIDRICQSNGSESRELVILAKFWDADRAEAFTARAQRLVNENW